MPLSARDATPADYAVFARLFPELKVPDPVLTQEEFEQRMLPNTIIAEDGEPVGYAFWRFYGAMVHVSHVIVDPRAQRRGVGRFMMEEIRRRTLGKGSTRWYLNVKADNTPAIRLYERVGLSVEQRGWSMRVDWSALRTLEGSTGTWRFAPTLEEASRFARERGIDPERLAMFRARPGVVFAALRNDAGTCALATFDPSFPSICPIAVIHPKHARPLFDAFLPHALHPYVRLCVDDEALVKALVLCGAKVEWETLRMGASLL
jgi:ribosomal protein S18 acetylase RimI-like enzyme